MEPQSPESRESPTPNGSQKRKGWVTGLGEDVVLSFADLPILACCAVSGLCDSVAFNAGGVFVSMQTGKSATGAGDGRLATQRCPDWG